MSVACQFDNVNNNQKSRLDQQIFFSNWQKFFKIHFKSCSLKTIDLAKTSFTVVLKLSNNLQCIKRLSLILE
jgi:hypothetical protein